MNNESQSDNHWDTHHWFTSDLVDANPAEFVDALVHDLLPDEIAHRLRQRIANSPELQARLAEAQQFQATLIAVPPEPIKPAVTKKATDQLESRLSRWRGFNRLLIRTYAALAASLLVLAGGNWWVQNSQPNDLDLRLVSQTTVMAGSPGVVHLTSYRHVSGELVESIPVSVSLLDSTNNRKIQLASFETGQTPPSIQWPDWEAGKYQLQIEAIVDGRTETLDQTVRIERPVRLLLSSDKPIYQPGQTIHLRSISLSQPSGKPLTDQPCTFRITDSRRNMIFKHTDSTSKFGIAHADCLLADELNPGVYRIECEVGSTKTSQPIRVERYALPKLGVTVQLDRPFYTAGDEVKAKVAAMYFFGEPVREGSIALKAADNRFETIALPTNLKTDEKGDAELSFKLPATLASSGRSTTQFELTCEVTDNVGQTASRAISITIADQPIQIEVIPGSATLALGENNDVFVYTCYADGQPVAASVVINEGEHEFKTNQLGIAKLSIKPKVADLRWTVRATDAAGLIGRRNVAISAAQGAMILRTDKVVYRSGDEIFVQALVSGAGQGSDPIFLDVVKQNQSMFHTTIPMSSGKNAGKDSAGNDRGKVSFTLPPEIHGTLQLIAYRYGRDGQLNRFSRLIHVESFDQVKIQATANQTRYRPGETAKLSMRVTDRDGKPVQAALGIVAVDEAVFGLLSGRTSLEQTLALIEQNLLKPGYMIYPAWEWRPGNPMPSEPAPAASWTVMTEGIFTRASNFLNSLRDAQQFANPFFRTTDSSSESDQVETELTRDRIRPMDLQISGYAQKESLFNQLKQLRIKTMFRIWVGLIVFGVVLTWVALMFRFPRSTIGLSVLFLLFATAQVSGCSASGPDGAVAAKSSANAARGREFDAMTGNELPSSGSAAPPRLRNQFPETLLWLPEIITDEQGQCEIEIPLADSITSWRVGINAVTGTGAVGGQTTNLEVFQPFFVDINTPAYLTLRDQVRIPIVVYNYLDQPQSVRISIPASDWYTSELEQDAEGNRVFELKIDPRSTKKIELPLKANRLGRHSLRVKALAGEVGDAIERTIDVLPNGQRFEQLTQGSLSSELKAKVSFPADAVEGSQRLKVKLVPSTFSMIVEGLDSIFGLPHGCFEQTSSTSYPNVLALRFLRDANLNRPEIEAKALQYIHTGFQRLLTFEIDGGGFDWFGRAPANLTLSAYGLMQFEDTATVADIDRGVVDRTRAWLKQQQRSDGSFGDGSDRNGPDQLVRGLYSNKNADQQALMRTAYVAWALNRNQFDPDLGATRSFLLTYQPAEISDAFVLATTINALIAMKATDSELDPYFLELIKQRKKDEAGQLTWWDMSDDQQALFYSRGNAASVEATSLAVLACVAAERHKELVPQAIDYLLKQRMGAGRWSTTQGTILALQALIAANKLTGSQPMPYEIEVLGNGEVLTNLKVEADQFDVVQTIDLSKWASEANEITVRERTRQRISAEVIQSYYRVVRAVEKPEALAIDVAYSSQTFAVDQTIQIDVTVANQTGRSLPMVMLDLPIPPGFRVDREGWEKLVASGTIARFELTPRQIMVYLRDLPSGGPLKLKYSGSATMPIRARVPAATVYEYYTPERRSSGGEVTLSAGEM